MLEFGSWAILGVVIFIITGILSVEVDSVIMSTATFGIGILTLEYGFNIAVLLVIIANPLWIFLATLLYIGAGSSYAAIWRWPEYIRQNKNSIMESYNRWAHDIKPTASTSFDTFLDTEHYEYNAWQHKERLGTWVGMWPFSLSWELSRKPAIWVWRTAYKSLGKMFQEIGRNTARKLHDKK